MTTEDTKALRLVNRFNGFYDVYSGDTKVAVAMSSFREWTVRRLRRDGSRDRWAWTAPTRRSALLMFAESEGYSL